MADTFRVTTYAILVGDWGSGTTLDLTLNQALEANYFALVNFGAAGGVSRSPDLTLVRIIQDPAGTGDLAASSGSDVIRLERKAGSAAAWGTVTIVECLGDSGASGFKLLDVKSIATGAAGTSGTATSASWSDIDQVVLFGGRQGGGVTVNSTTLSDTAKSGAVRLWPSGTDTVNWSRAGGPIVAADVTVYVVEWGSEWTVQRANVTGSSGGDGINATGEYNTAAITSATRANTWVWGCGTSSLAGIGNGAYGMVPTLGDGVTQNASETSVAVGSEYTGTKDWEVYVLEHADIAVDYRFKADGNAANSNYDHTVDAASGSETYGVTAGGIDYTEGYRIPVQFNTSNGTGSAYPRPFWFPRHTGSTTLNAQRNYSGQAWAAWVQSVDLSAVTYTPAPAATDEELFFGCNV